MAHVLGAFKNAFNVLLVNAAESQEYLMAVFVIIFLVVKLNNVISKCN